MDHNNHNHEILSARVINDPPPIKEIIRMALETRPDDIMMEVAFLANGKEYGPFYDDAALKWVSNNTELLDRAIEEGMLGIAITGIPVSVQDDKFTPNSRMN